MAEALLNVEKRDDLSKHVTKEMRRSGRVPAVYYMHGEKSIAVSVDEKAFKGVLHSDHSIIDLAFSPKKKVKSVIREIQWHPVSGAALHVDFLGIKMTEKIVVDLPLHLVGTSVGVKTHGGILQQQLRELSIECLPSDIPEHFELDITALELGDSIHVSDLDIENVKILTDAGQPIVIVREPRIEVEEEAGDDELESGDVEGVEGGTTDEGEATSE